MQPPTQPFVDGIFTSGSGAPHPLVNPTTEETWCEVDAASENDADRAVQSAQRTFEKTWRDLAPGKRARIYELLARGTSDVQQAARMREALAPRRPSAA